MANHNIIFVCNDEGRETVETYILEEGYEMASLKDVCNPTYSDRFLATILNYEEIEPVKLLIAFHPNAPEICAVHFSDYDPTQFTWADSNVSL